MSTLDDALAAALRARLEARARELNGELALAHDKRRTSVEAGERECKLPRSR